MRVHGELHGTEQCIGAIVPRGRSVLKCEDFVQLSLVRLKGTCLRIAEKAFIALAKDMNVVREQIVRGPVQSLPAFGERVTLAILRAHTSAGN